jgi:hypothetical protein
MFDEPNLLALPSIENGYLPVANTGFNPFKKYLYHKVTNRMAPDDVKKGDYIIQFLRYYSPEKLKKQAQEQGVTLSPTYYETTWRQHQTAGDDEHMTEGSFLSARNDTFAQFRVFFCRESGEANLSKWRLIMPQLEAGKTNFNIIGKKPRGQGYAYDFYLQINVRDIKNTVYDLGVYGDLITKTFGPISAMELHDRQPPSEHPAKEEEVHVLDVQDISEVIELTRITEEVPDGVDLLVDMGNATDVISNHEHRDQEYGFILPSSSSSSSSKAKKQDSSRHSSENGLEFIATRRQTRKKKENRWRHVDMRGQSRKRRAPSAISSGEVEQVSGQSRKKRASSIASHPVSANVSDQLDEGTCFNHATTRIVAKAARTLLKKGRNKLLEEDGGLDSTYVASVYNVITMQDVFYHVGVCDAIFQQVNKTGDVSSSGNNLLLYTYLYVTVMNSTGCTGGHPDEACEHLIRTFLDRDTDSYKVDVIVKNLQQKRNAMCQPQKFRITKMEYPYIHRISHIVTSFLQALYANSPKGMLKYMYAFREGRRPLSEAEVELLNYVFRRGYYVAFSYYLKSENFSHAVVAVDLQEDPDNEFILVLKNSWGREFGIDIAHLIGSHEAGVVRAKVNEQKAMDEINLSFILPASVQVVKDVFSKHPEMLGHLSLMSCENVGSTECDAYGPSVGCKNVQYNGEIRTRCYAT